MELTSAVRSVSSSNKCNGMITAARKNQADALNPHPPHGESFFLSPSLGTPSLFHVSTFLNFFNPPTHPTSTEIVLNVG